MRRILYTREIAACGGQSVPNRNAWDVDAVAESGDMVGGSDKFNEAYGELLGCPSTHLH
jgi:hypothetical protein